MSHETFGCANIQYLLKGTVNKKVTLHVKMGLPESQRFPHTLCLIKHELDIYVYNLRFLYKSDLNISTAGKHMGIIRILNFQT